MMSVDRTRRARKRRPMCPGKTLDEAVTTILASSSTPLSAYDLLDVLRERCGVRNPMPVYRSLSRLCARSVVQRVESVSGYRALENEDAVLLICTKCGTTTSLPAPEHCLRMRSAADMAKFRVERLILEAVGICESCRRADKLPAPGQPIGHTDLDGVESSANESFGSDAI